MPCIAVLCCAMLSSDVPCIVVLCPPCHRILAGWGRGTEGGAGEGWGGGRFTRVRGGGGFVKGGFQGLREGRTRWGEEET